MRSDHRPYPVKRLVRLFEHAFVNHFLRPQLDALGPHAVFMKPWRVKLHGPNIRFGRSVHVVTAPDRHVCLTTWRDGADAGSIDIGDYALLCPGVRIDSALRVQVGTNSMIASGAYLTDADWHDIYDRSRPIGNRAPVELGDNVWIGDGALVCKGVTIGRNTVVGAGSVVTGDLPENVIAAGNPARVIRPLDPDRPMVTRAALLADADRLDRDIDALDRHLLGHNGAWHWLRSLMWPMPGD